MLALILAACLFVRIRQPRDLVSHLEMAIEFPAIWRELALRRFGSGDSAEDLLRICPPNRSDTFGRYGIYEYFHDDGGLPMSGITVAARDGKLISATAGGCTWKYSFFDVPDPELDRQYELYVTEKRKKFELKRIDKLEGHLLIFRKNFERWPTNVKEFATFVTGSSDGGTNPLSVVLRFNQDDSVEISGEQYPEERRTISR